MVQYTKVTLLSRDPVRVEYEVTSQRGSFGPRRRVHHCWWSCGRPVGPEGTPVPDVSVPGTSKTLQQHPNENEPRIVDANGTSKRVGEVTQQQSRRSSLWASNLSSLTPISTAPTSRFLSLALFRLGSDPCRSRYRSTSTLSSS